MRNFQRAWVDVDGMRRRAPWFVDGEKPGATEGKLWRARTMRREPTAGEAKLWAELRERRLGGWRFRRQHVIAGYIVDFYCPELRMALEVDGGVHDAQRAQDAERDEHLARLGVCVLRVRDGDMKDRLPDVLRFIAAQCEGIADADDLLERSSRPQRR